MLEAGPEAEAEASSRTIKHQAEPPNYDTRSFGQLWVPDKTCVWPRQQAPAQADSAPKIPPKS
jgi:hypothetical protein